MPRKADHRRNDYLPSLTGSCKITCTFCISKILIVHVCVWLIVTSRHAFTSHSLSVLINEGIFNAKLIICYQTTDIRSFRTILPRHLLSPLMRPDELAKDAHQ